MTRLRFHDVVAWDALVAPGVIIQKDGSFLSAWRAEGIDTGYLAADQVQVRRIELARGLTSLKTDETLWMVWQRRPWEPVDLIADVDDPALDSLAAETNVIFAEPGRIWHDDFLIWLRIKLPTFATDLDRALEAYEGRRRIIESWLQDLLGLTRIDGARQANRPPTSIVSELGKLVQSPRANDPRLAELPVALDALLAPEVLQPRATGPMYCSGKQMTVMTLMGEREEYRPSPLEPLQNLDIGFTWVTRYQALSRTEAKDALFWKRKQLKQSAADFAANIEGSSSGDRSVYSEQLIAETEITRAAIERGEEGHGNFLSVLMMTEDDWQRDPDGTSPVQRLHEAVQQTGFLVRPESAGAVATFLAALPGHAHAVPREVMVRAQVMADCSPLRGFGTGSATCPSPLLPAGTPALLPAVTFARTLHHFNLHVGDVGHTLIFGPTGTGKSLMLGHLIAAWLRYPDSQVVVFDRGRSQRYLTAAVRGRWLEPGPPDPSADNSLKAGVAPIAQIKRLGLDWATNWIRTLIGCSSDQPLTPEQLKEITKTLKGLLDVDRPTLQELEEQIQDKGLQHIIQSWRGANEAIVDSPNPIDIGAALNTSRLVGFETQYMIDSHKNVALLILDYIFAEMERQFDSRPTLIVIDEAWKLLEHELFRQRLQSWLKEGRKKNVALLMATQSVTDANKTSAITPLLVESCPTKLFLANPEAATETQAHAYAAFGVEPHRVEMIANLRKRQNMMLLQGECARVISMPFGPTAITLLGTTATAKSRVVDQREAENPDFWKADVAAEIAKLQEQALAA
ncbi:MAG: hypothetical protein OXC63_08295 [Aestuariivita sp.]|nr:hypothetical protein [Aestuariivita sp.]MCY4345391.1 hypothetical protein [Aestuariivita sp.]